MNVSRTEDAILNEIASIQKNMTSVWGLYMSWYTFFFTSNLVVMSWIFTKPGTFAYNDAIWMLCVFWMVFNLSGVATSIWMTSYTKKGADRICDLFDLIEDYDLNYKQELPFPLSLVVYGGYANATSLLFNVAIWAFIWINFNN